jgi:hypothetical protein
MQRAARLADYYRDEAAGTPAISPDGPCVVFVRNITVESGIGAQPSCGSARAPRWVRKLWRRAKRIIIVGRPARCGGPELVGKRGWSG